jgi:hypothetical protein
MHVSFTGNVTFKKSTLDEVLIAVPADRFMIETDSPYITPVPFRGKRNEPSYVRYIAEKISSKRKTTTEDVITMTTMTAKKLFRLLTLLILLPVALWSQDEEDEHPFPKKLGGGFLLASNTIVDSRTYVDIKGLLKTDEPYSYEGIFAYGAQLDYCMSDRLIAEFAFLHSKNNKVVRDAKNNPFGQLQPNTHQSLELVVKYLMNPYSRVVFYGTIGGGAAFNKYNGGSDFYDDSLRINGKSTVIPTINAGIGFFVNVNSPIGLFTPCAEWRLDFFFNKQQTPISLGADKNGVNKTTEAEIGTYFSLPRFSLLWYPKF